MLQQTQVERVIPFYAKFVTRFPTAKKLAGAPLADVLKAWQGLGYNRRAKMLHQAAKVLSVKKVATIDEWEALPGVGPYTARAVAAFARNEDVIFVETNIRTVIIHHFFGAKRKVSDAEIEKVLTDAFPKGKSREWYSALMDYGAFLKGSGISHNSRSSKYVKQAKFSGSLREVRGAILRALMQESVSGVHLEKLFGRERRAQCITALSALVIEGLVQKTGRSYALTQ